MTEKQLYHIFAQKIKIADPDSFWYKIPDTKGLGGKKPFDGFLVCKGIPFAIEFKLSKKEPTRLQQYSLEKFYRARGVPLVFKYPKMNMDIFINNILMIANKEGNRNEV